MSPLSSESWYHMSFPDLSIRLYVNDRPPVPPPAPFPILNLSLRRVHKAYEAWARQVISLSIIASLSRMALATDSLYLFIPAIWLWVPANFRPYMTRLVFHLGYRHDAEASFHSRSFPFDFVGAIGNMPIEWVNRFTAPLSHAEALSTVGGEPPFPSPCPCVSCQVIDDPLPLTQASVNHEDPSTEEEYPEGPWDDEVRDPSDEPPSQIRRFL